jgi:hypothetical protein
VPVSELLQQSGPYGAVIALISFLAYWLRLRHIRLMAKEHSPDYALRYANILFRLRPTGSRGDGVSLQVEARTFK